MFNSKKLILAVILLAASSFAQIINPGGSGGPTAWSAITAPTGTLSLTMPAGDFTSLTWATQAAPANPDWLFTAGADSGVSAVAAFSFIDTTGNTKTGALVNINTVGTSTAKPLQVTAQGTANGVQMSTTGLLAPLGTGGINASQVNGNTLPAAAGFTSGGIPFYSSTSAEGSSALLTANSPVIGGGAGVAPKTVAGITSDGTSKVTLGVAGTSVGAVALNNATSGSVTVQPVTGALGAVTASLPANTGTIAETNLAQTFTGLQTFTNGIGTGASPPAITAGTAGAWGCAEGTAFTNVASTAGIYCDSTSHEFMAKTNGAATAGMMVRTQPGAINQTTQTAAITTATLCASAAGACNTAGQYRIHWNFWGSGTACSSVTAGSVGLNLTWTDENATAHTTISVPMWDQKSAANGILFNFNTALGTEGASGDYTISTNGSVIQYATTYTACTTGTGTYNLRATVERIQ